MWYKVAKRGSLWSRISPTFEQDVDKAISSSFVQKDFESVKKYVIDLDKFQDIFRQIPNNPLSDYKFFYSDVKDTKGGAYCDRYNKEIVIGTLFMHNIGWVKSTIKHEIIHAIEGTIPGLIESELYSHPEQHSSKLFKNYIANQTPLERKKLENFLYYDNLLLLDDIDDEEERSNKAKELTQRTIRELERRSNSLSGDFDLYMANPSELRAFRSEIDNAFSLENLKQVYHGIYENVENGKELYLKSFYELIQFIVNVKDTSDNYFNQFYSNLMHVADMRNFDERFSLQVIRNLNPQYIRQIAKFLSDQYIEIKSYLNSYVPDTSETEVL